MKYIDYKPTKDEVIISLKLSELEELVRKSDSVSLQEILWNAIADKSYCEEVKYERSN